MSGADFAAWVAWLLGLFTVAVLVIVGLGALGVFDRLGDASGVVGIALGVLCLLGSYVAVLRRL